MESYVKIVKCTLLLHISHLAGPHATRVRDLFLEFLENYDVPPPILDHPLVRPRSGLNRGPQHMTNYKIIVRTVKMLSSLADALLFLFLFLALAFHSLLFLPVTPGGSPSLAYLAILMNSFT